MPTFATMKFLIIQTAFIGDVILATPLVEKLRRFYPGADIDFLLRKGNEKLLTGHPNIRQLLVWEKKRQKYSSLWRLLGQIRNERYDCIINCQRFAASGILTALGGAHATVGFDKNPFAFAFGKKVVHRFGNAQHPVHEVDRNLRLIEHLTDKSFERPRLYPSSTDEQKAGALAATGSYVCMAPTSVWFTKQLPAHKWVDLIRFLSPEIKIFLLGGPDDWRACEAIKQASASEQVQNLAGQLSFLESAALMQGAGMNYVNDSAPMHMASSVNAAVTAFFCSTIPAFGFTPLSDQRQIIETTQALDCRPCGLHGYRACPKGHFACAETIDIGRLFLKETV